MKEFEAKFTGFTLESARELLDSHGYTCASPEILMTRKAFHVEGNKNKWARVRDEGNQITLTIKEIVKDNDLSGVNEAEVIINNFDEGVKVLEMSGFYGVAFQETKREIWHKDSIEVMIDTWPGLTPFIEVEGPSEQSVISACKELNLNMEEALFGGVDTVYTKQVGITAEMINNLDVLTFEKPPTLEMFMNS
ncbi:MAG: CYTH domain-containing protein [Pseudomonadota bacterium]|nr:CYTH domain-containing protein [Pseudomonadota bacterium]